jgi:phosphoribosyl 1,2-cyclic phosphodiesterase
MIQIVSQFSASTHQLRLGVTVLGSGSGGNAAVVHSPDGNPLVDAGFSMVELRRRLEIAKILPESLHAILVTHEHGDHVKGLRVVAKALKIPVYCNRGTADVLRGKELAPEHGLKIFTTGSAFAVDGFAIEPFSIPHDTSDPVAFTFRFGDLKLGIATDFGHASSLVAHHLSGCDLLVVESNHDVRMLWDSSRPPRLKQRILSKVGHLSNEDCAKLLHRILHARTRHLVLAHASSECNCHELVERAARACLQELARADLTPHVARQDAPLPTFWV